MDLLTAGLMDEWMKEGKRGEARYVWHQETADYSCEGSTN